MKHLGLWLYSIGVGAVIGTVVGMLIAPSGIALSTVLLGLVLVVTGFAFAEPADMEYIP